MRRTNFAALVITAILLAACSIPAVTPTPRPQPPTPAEPSPLPATPSPDEPISATPRPSDPEPLNPQPLPFAPAPGDADLARGTAFVERAQIIIAESFPPQYFLSVAGSLPSPCHQLRVSVSPASGQSRITVDVYSVADPYAVCSQILQPFEVNVPLGSFAAGEYEVWVNGQPVGEIAAP
ncbi:MAG: hypothetical protein FJ030_13930 [Chloroflexi bacterium]|nr:hypothetical protein [Chloroflexota bacterium]